MSRETTDDGAECGMHAGRHRGHRGHGIGHRRHIGPIVVLTVISTVAPESGFVQELAPLRMKLRRGSDAPATRL
eukprot:1045115-Prorocentrum_lima.AAC.1